MASTVVLLVTGYAWVSLDDLNTGLSTSDVTAGGNPDGSVDILLVGRDSRTDTQGNPLPADTLARLRAGDNEADLTDTMILLHIPQDRSEAVAYSLPRDSYVSIPDGHGKHKINSAFGRGKAEAAESLQAEGVNDPAEMQRRSSDAGRRLLVRTVEDLSGVGIDRYAEVNLLGFFQITQSVGGVEVCLNKPVDDERSGADFPAGRQTISGADALSFVRQRYGLPRGDLDRVVRQQAFLAGLARSMLSTGVLTNPGKLADLVDSIQQAVVLSDGWDVLTFAQQLQGMAAGNIRFDTIPVDDPEYDTPDGQAVRVDPDRVADTIQQGTTATPGSSSRQPEPPPLDAVTVDVLNTTNRTGLAARVLADLGEVGMPIGDARNATATDSSRVQYSPGAGDTARYIAEELNDLPADRDPTLADGTIHVLLGNDYEETAPPSTSSKPTSSPTTTPERSAATPPEDRITAGDIPCIN
ncbi:LCP family protein [Amycolatopsis palatopharyngis]|uniref:LCP family protein n=1 Tax=Amycolatopsis palatopharyngis TaxID=187982 RepID=UPI001FE96F86|nr:LCP family protein [Amycolatopsis palatopharyngis]